MDAIAKNVYIEERFPGVTLGVIVQSRGLIQIDVISECARLPDGQGLRNGE